MTTIHEANNNQITISDVNVINVIDSSLKLHVTVQIKDGLITHLDESLDYQLVADEPKLWAIPGLIDCHVHLFERNEGKDKGLLIPSEGYKAAAQRALANVLVLLGVGVTCARDVGAFSAYNNQLRDIIEADITKYKFRLLSCGHHISRKNGHWCDRGVIWDPQTSLASLVANELKSADFIKVMNDDQIFNLAELKAIASVCMDKGRKFACHAFTKDMIELAISGGADTIEHGICYSDDLCERALKQGLAVCPTVVAALDFKQNMKEVLRVTPDCQQKEIEDWIDLLCEHLPGTLKAGVRVIAGTDAGTVFTDFKSLPREIVGFSRMGASPIQALQTATINAAYALGINDITGSIEINKSADIVLLGKNPLENLEEALHDIRMVISRGLVAVNRLALLGSAQLSNE